MPLTSDGACAVTSSWYIRIIYARNDSVFIWAAMKSTNASLLNVLLALRVKREIESS